MTKYVISAGVTTGYTLNAGDTLTVLSGGIAENVVVNSGGVEIISAGGIASSTKVGLHGIAEIEGGLAIATTVSAGGQLLISSGGLGSGTTLLLGGVDAVYAGGSAVSTTISANSVEVAFSGGTVIGTQILAQGALIAVPGATVEQPFNQNGGFEITSGYAVLIASGGVGTLPAGATVSGQVIVSGSPGFVLPGGNFVSGFVTSGAELDVYAGGAVSTTIVEPDGNLLVYSGGSTASTTVLRGGLEQVVSGGAVLSAAALSGGTIYLDGGVGSEFLVENSGSLLFEGGGSATNVTVSDGGVISAIGTGQLNGVYVSGGGDLVIGNSNGVVGGFINAYNGTTLGAPGTNGAAKGAFIYSGGSATISAGGLISSFAVYSAAQLVMAGGTSLFATIDAGGTETINSGGLAVNSIIDGAQIVNSGGESLDVSVVSGGKLAINSGGYAGSALVAVGGAAEIGVGATLALVVISSGGTLIADAGAILSGGVYFGGSGGDYVTSNATGLTTISNFQLGDLLDAAALPFLSAGSATLGAGNVLTVTEGAATFTAQFDGSVAGETFAWSADGTSGTDIQLVQTVISVTAANSPDNSPHVSATDVLAIGSGAVVNNAYVLSGGSVEVFSGGTANATFMLVGSQTVFAGGVASATQVGSSYQYPGGAAEIVASGGLTSDTEIFAGGTEQIEAGGTGLGVQLGQSDGGGGGLTAVSGATLSGTQIYGGGTLSVFAGATVLATTLHEGYTQYIGASPDPGGTLFIGAGAVASGVLLEGGTVEIAAGGTLADPVVSAGLLILSSGSILDSPATAGGGAILLLPGGVISGAVASGTDIISSGVVLLSNGGLASAGRVFVETAVPYQGSPLIVLPGGTTSLTRLDDGGLEILYGGTAIASYLPDGAVQSVGSGGTALATILAGGTEIVAAGGQLTSGVSFTGSGAELITYNTSAGARLSSFNDTSLLDAAVLPFFAAGSGALGSGDVLTVSQGAFTFTAQFGSASADAVFGWSADGTGGTLIRLLYDQQVVSGAGNSAVSATILASDEIVAISGGVISGTIVDSAGLSYISAGGTALATTLNNDGAQYVEGGGTAVSTTLNYGATQYVESGAVVSNTIFNTGTQVLESGAIQSGAQIGFGQEIVSGGAIAISDSVADEGTLEILSGASASGTQVGVGIQGGTLIIQSGGSAVGTQVGINGFEIVQAGGIVSGGAVSGAGYQGNANTVAYNLIVSGVAISVTLLADGYAVVSAGGTALDTQLRGDLVVSAAGILSGTVVQSGGTETVLTGGAASGTVVQAFGRQVITGFSTQSLGVPVPGVAYDTQIASGGEVVATYGGVASNTQIASGGVLVISSGGVAYSPDIASGGAVIVLAGGAISGVVSGSGDIISSGVALFVPGVGVISQTAALSGLVVGNTQTAYVLSGGSTTGTAVMSGGYEYVGDGGVASGTTLDPSTEYVASGGVAIATSVLSGSVVNVAAGGVISNVNVGLDGTLFVSGSAIGTTLSANAGVETLLDGLAFTYASGYALAAMDAGATMSDTLVENGGILNVDGGTAFDTTILSGGYVQVINGGATVSNTTIAGGILGLEDFAIGSNFFAGRATGTLTFEGTGGKLVLEDANDPPVPVPTISGFTPGNTIELYGFTGSSLALGPGNVLSASGNGQSFALQLDPSYDYSHDTFSLDPVDALVTVNALCFARGTRIRTPAGEIPVEALKIGDLVLTQSGAARPVKWIGQRDYDGRFIAGNHLMLPVTFRRHALGHDMPVRALTVSPGHGIALDGALIPAWRLINGVSVTQAEAVERIAYFHIELDSHDVIFAEGCPAETYLDEGERHQFHNAPEYAALYPQPQPATPCLPRLESGLRLLQLQRRVNALVAPAMPPAGPLRGFLDDAGAAGNIRGWAQDAANPEATVALDIWVGGNFLGRVVANEYRPDLRAAGLGSGCHGFSLPYPAGLHGEVSVRRSSDQTLLPRSGAALVRVA